MNERTRSITTIYAELTAFPEMRPQVRRGLEDNEDDEQDFHLPQEEHRSEAEGQGKVQNNNPCIGGGDGILALEDFSLALDQEIDNK